MSRLRVSLGVVGSDRRRYSALFPGENKNNFIQVAARHQASHQHLTRLPLCFIISVNTISVATWFLFGLSKQRLLTRETSLNQEIWYKAQSWSGFDKTCWIYILLMALKEDKWTWYQMMKAYGTCLYLAMKPLHKVCKVKQHLLRPSLQALALQRSSMWTLERWTLIVFIPVYTRPHIDEIKQK